MNTTGSEPSGPNPGQRPSRGGTRGGRGRQRWKRGHQTKHNFTGKTKEMNGHVFQLRVEQKKKGQFQETLEQLQVYASLAYKNEIKYLKVLFTQLQEPNIIKPEPPKGGNTQDDTIYREEVRQYIKEKRNLDTTLVSIYNVVWGQCSKLLQNKLKSNPKYTSFDDNSDVVSLLTEIKTLSNQLEENVSSYDALHEAKTKLFQYQQSEDESLADHMRNFKALCSTVDYHGGDVFFDKEMVEKEIREDIKKNIKTIARDEYRVRVTERAKAVAFIKSANKKRYGKLMTTIREQHSFKIDVYPRTLVDAYEMLAAHVNNVNNQSNKATKESRNNSNTGTETQRSDNTNRNGISYLQTEAVPGNDGRLVPHITCYNCRRKGHYADNCPGETNTSNNNQQHMQTVEGETCEEQSEVDHGEAQVQHLQLAQQDSDIVHFSWNMMTNNKGQQYKDTDILLDTGSTFSVFKNPEMVLNIRNSPHTLKAYTNGGRQDSVQVADVPGFFTVWYNTRSMINILAWCDVSNKFRITADTSKGKFITVHLSDERRMIFEEVESGLHLFRNKVHHTTNNKISGYSYLMLTEAKLSNFNKHEIEGAEKARELHRALGYPGYGKYLWLLKHNKIKDSKVTIDDAKRSLHIFGEESATVKGKTT